MRRKNRDSEIRITCTEQQARLVARSLELLSRVHAGQLNHLDSELVWFGKRGLDVDRSLARMAMGIYKKAWFPELDEYSSYGIPDTRHIPEEARHAYEMYKWIENALSCARGVREGCSTHPPLDVTGLPRMEVEVVKIKAAAK